MPYLNNSDPADHYSKDVDDLASLDSASFRGDHKEFRMQFARDKIHYFADHTSARQLINDLSKLQDRGCQMVMVSGVFDLIHAGHLYYLELARQSADCVVAHVGSDDSVMTTKRRATTDRK